MEKEAPSPIRAASPLVGAGLMLGAVGFSTVELVFVHALGPDWPAPLQLFWRQGVALIILLPLILRDRRNVFRVSRPGVMLFRSMAAMSALLMSIYAYSHLPLATANALSFTRPLWIVLLAALFLGEKVDRWRGAAVLMGFAGVLVMLDLSSGLGGNLAAEAASLASALLFAASFVSIKSMTGDNRTLTIILYGVLFGLLISALPAAMAWKTPDLRDAVMLSCLGVTSLGGFAMFTAALRLADATQLVTLDYLRLPLAAIIGIALFNEIPGGSMLAGTAMIAAASLLVWWRERRKSGDRASAAAPAGE